MLRPILWVPVRLLMGVALVGCTSQPAPDSAPAPTPAASIGETAGESAATTSARPAPSVSALATAEPTTTPSTPSEPQFTVETFPVPAGSHPHDVAPAVDGGVWYTAQHTGELGWLDPETGEIREVPLGAGSSPHGVIVGPDEAAWVTDGGLNAIVRVDAETLEVSSYPLPPSVPNVNLNTATFDGAGMLWFTGQAGYYGSVDPATGEVLVYDAPRGTGPYGIATTPDGEVYYSSLAGSYLGAIDRAEGDVAVIDPPTAGAGLRRVWSDSRGRLWVSEWSAGQVGVYDPYTVEWREWRLPGDAPQAYSVYVDETDSVWLTDFGANAIVHFDPETETFTSFPAESQPAEVRQQLGRPGEVWGAESAADQLVVVNSGD